MQATNVDDVAVYWTPETAHDACSVQATHWINGRRLQHHDNMVCCPAPHAQVTLLFGQVKRGMIRGTLNITLDHAVAKCYGRVPWMPALPNLPGYPVDPSIFI